MPVLLPCQITPSMQSMRSAPLPLLVAQAVHRCACSHPQHAHHAQHAQQALNAPVSTPGGCLPTTGALLCLLHNPKHAQQALNAPVSTPGGCGSRGERAPAPGEGGTPPPRRGREEPSDCRAGWEPTRVMPPAAPRTSLTAMVRVNG